MCENKIRKSHAPRSTTQAPPSAPSEEPGRVNKERHEQEVAHRGVNVIVPSIISNNKPIAQWSCNGQE